MIPRRPSPPPITMPAWGWWLLGALAALLALPWALALYARWWRLALDGASGALVEFLMPRVG